MRRLGAKHASEGVRETNRIEDGEMKKGKAKEIKRFYLGKCGKTEKVFTGNKIPQPKKINHVAAK